MNEEIVYIDHMSSPRDILLVSQALEHLGLRVKEIEIGAAAFINKDQVERKSIGRALENIGYALVDPEQKLFTERVRSLVSTFIDGMLRSLQPWSLEKYLEVECQQSYVLICDRFYRITGQRLRTYFKRMRIERVKIMLNHSSMPLEEIAEKLGFKTAKNLSRVFKEVTGQSISAYGNRHVVVPVPIHKSI